MMMGCWLGLFLWLLRKKMDLILNTLENESRREVAWVPAIEAFGGSATSGSNSTG